MTDKRPYVPVQRDCYVLVEITAPDVLRIYDRYDVVLREEGLTCWPAGQYRVVEEGRDTCAAEWSRLYGVCEDLRRVAEVMES